MIVSFLLVYTNLIRTCDLFILGTDKEKAVLVPQVKDYNNLGQECVGVGCSVDMFVFNNAYIDVATISQVKISFILFFEIELMDNIFTLDCKLFLIRSAVYLVVNSINTHTFNLM